MTSLKHNIKRFTGLLLAAMAISGCASDDFDDPSRTLGAEEAQLVVRITLPQSMADSETRAAISTPTDDECRVNNLRIIAFSESGTKLINQKLGLDKVNVAHDRTYEYRFSDIKEGNYRIFVVGNISDEALSGVTNENSLRSVILDWTSQLPQAGNLPMVYEPTAGVGVPAEASKNPAVHELTLQFACVKLRYNIIFDKDYNKGHGDAFGDSGLSIKKLTLSNISDKSNAVYNTNNVILTKLDDKSLSGKYFGAYTETIGNAEIDNKYVVETSGDAASAPAVSNKWVYQGELYIPERYADEVAKQTTLNIEAVTTQGSTHHYTLPLGGGIGAEDPDSKDLPRNTYYEVIAHITSLGSTDLDATIVAKDWMQQLLPLDFIHTYLTLSTTKLTVNSLDGAELTYQTDGRGGVSYGCDTHLLDGFKVVNFTEDNQTGTLRVDVNPEIDILELAAAQRRGTAMCWVKAGNIKKYFSVEYDIVPFFIIKPADVKIQWDNSGQNSKVFEYRTNLGGIVITKDGSFNNIHYIGGTTKSWTVNHPEVSSKSVTLSCSDPTAAIGTITVKANEDPGTTIVYDFDDYPEDYERLTNEIKSQMVTSSMENLQVTVMPPLGGYRIYFRAINDYHIGNSNDNKTTEFLSSSNYTLPTEGVGNNNWIDYWNNQGIPSGNDEHRIYIYTQFGETSGTTITGPVWKFTNDYGNNMDQMKRDNSNKGWYYYDLPATKQAIGKENMDKASTAQKEYYNIPRPGETLIIFTNAYEPDLGYTLHRASHHLDPGIPLFDYEDREGYVLYDPTSEPYYYIFDEKPIIEDVTYTIYSPGRVTGWFQTYGNASNQVPTDAQRYTVWSNHVTSTQSGGMYTTTIKLKAPRGEHAKAIKVKFDFSVPRRVYFKINSEWDSKGVPRIYMFGSSGDSGWYNNIFMYPVDGTTNLYYYDVPSQYNKVIFRSGPSADYQHPNSGGLDVSTTGAMLCDGTNNFTWTAYTTNVESVLFGGRAFSGDRGYFNGTRWSTSKNF